MGANQSVVRVLIVDDDALLRQFLARFLRGADGIKVVGDVGSGEQALRFLADAAADVCITDVVMPQMSGFELMAIVREHLPDVKVIVLSGVVPEREALSVGADAHVLKGSDPGELIEKIRRVADAEDGEIANRRPGDGANDKRHVDSVDQADVIRRFQHVVRDDVLPHLESVHDAASGFGRTSDRAERSRLLRLIEGGSLAASKELGRLLTLFGTRSDDERLHDILVALHDDVLPHLHAIRLRMHSVGDVRGTEHSEIVSLALAASSVALNSLRALIRGATTVDRKLGPRMSLDEQLKRLCIDVAADGLNVELVDDVGRVDLSAGVCRAIVYAVREALANTLRHSGQKGALIRAVADSDGVRITVKDRGRGFRSDGNLYGFGIRHSIEGQLARVGGFAKVNSAPGRGTKVMLWAPAQSK